MLCREMGGTLISLLDKYIELPKTITIISAPTDMEPIFRKVFRKNRLNERAVKKVFERINSFGEYTLSQVSLINSKLYKNRSVLMIHDENDREIPFSEFENIQAVWQSATFHATQGLGHRRILRDEPLAKYIANFISTNPTI